MDSIPWEKAQLAALVKLSFSRRKPSSYSARWMTAFWPSGLGKAATLLLGIPAGLLLGEAKGSIDANNAPIPLGG